MTTETIGFAIIFLIVAIFLSSIRIAVLPFMNSLTTAVYDFVILVFVGVGILQLLLIAIGSKQPTKTTGRTMSRPVPMRTEMSRGEF